MAPEEAWNDTAALAVSRRPSCCALAQNSEVGFPHVFGSTQRMITKAPLRATNVPNVLRLQQLPLTPFLLHLESRWSWLWRCQAGMPLAAVVHAEPSRLVSILSIATPITFIGSTFKRADDSSSALLRHHARDTSVALNIEHGTSQHLVLPSESKQTKHSKAGEGIMLDQNYVIKVRTLWYHSSMTKTHL